MSFDPLLLLLTAAACCALSGLPGVFMGRKSVDGQRIAAVIMVLGGLLGFAAALTPLLNGRSVALTIAWGLPFGPCELALDPLSALFLLAVFLVSACCSVYGVGYWSADEQPESAQKLTFFFGLFSSSMVILLLARNMVLFLAAWEVMSLSAYFVLAVEDNRREVREAGFIYLAATHVGALALFAMFSILASRSGSFAFPPAGALDALAPLSTAIAAAALVGFGMKAGLMPLHIWLPAAHSNAPSHVSAIMSGVMIKMGIYGVLRIISFFGNPPLWWGETILSLGAVTGVLGVAFALGQRDIKRLMAYSSIDNIGIIAMGVGAALIGRATGNAPLVILGMGGALMHILNHAIFKPLLFLNAGAVIHATGTREIDQMGGLARRMPVSALLFIIGSLAICGLPPLNGFVGEYLIYLGFFNGIRDGAGAAAPFLAMAAPTLALIGGLAAACFVKVYGMVFLGSPRREEPHPPHEANRLMLAPTALLAGLAIFVGVLPSFAARLLEYPILAWAPELAGKQEELAGLAQFWWISLAGFTLIALALLLLLFFIRRVRSAPAAAAATWGCAYKSPTARMQYTGSSFTESLVMLFKGVLRPVGKNPEIKGYFPVDKEYASSIPDMVLDLFVMPVSRLLDHWLSFVRKLQHGEYHLYILYIFVTMVALLIWAR